MFTPDMYTEYQCGCPYQNIPLNDDSDGLSVVSDITTDHSPIFSDHNGKRIPNKNYPPMTLGFFQ